MPLKHVFLLFALFFTLQLTAQSWEEVSKLYASDPDVEDRFSKSVAISGDYCIVGAHREDFDAEGNDSLAQAGAAYLFRRTEEGQWTFVQKLTASDRAVQDNFGTAVSISGNYAAIAAYKRDEPDPVSGALLSQVGAVYIFERDATGHWNEVQKLLASDMDSLNYFGKSVSIDGDRLLVGAAYRNEFDASGNLQIQAGVAYVFERNADGIWEEKQKLMASDLASFDIFGWSVSISGDRALVGAYQHDVNGKTDAGAAYVFTRDADGHWAQTASLTATDAAPADWFGYAVAIEGDVAAIGAYREDEDAQGLNHLQDAGSVYVFEKSIGNTWEQTAKLTASDRSAGDQLGGAVAVAGDFVLAGAYGADEDAEGANSLTDAGAAYLYQKQADGQWVETTKLTASDREAGDWFGFSVAIDGGHCTIGAFGEDGPDSGTYPLPNAGAVYVFENDQVSASTAVAEGPFVRLFPVPTGDYLQITLSEDSPAHAGLYDMQGRMLDEMTFSGSTSLPMVLYGQGIYVLRIRYGNQLIVKRIIKH